VTVLLSAENVTYSADLHVSQGDLIAEPNECEFSDCFERFCAVSLSTLSGLKHGRHRLERAAPYASAQLIHLRQAELIGLIDNDVFVFGMSKPDSIMVVQTRISN